jgi:anaerobic ribonucleoside-triphosphate reductase activating protein
MELRVAGIVKESIVDGPGIRYVVFAQGCPHQCRGCHNPQTWDSTGGEIKDTAEILKEIKKGQGLKGVTFSGGEPFEQAEALVILGKEVKKLGLNIITYTGYAFEELIELGKSNPWYQELLNLTDILIDGPFMLELKALDLPFRGSTNQRIIDVQASLSTKELKYVG